MDDNKYLGVHDNEQLLDILLDIYCKYITCLDGNEIVALGNDYRQARELLLFRMCKTNL